MDRLSAVIAKPAVSVQAQKAYSELDALNAKLADLGKKSPTAKVQADTAAAKAKIDLLLAKLDEIDRRDVEIKVKASADLQKAQAGLDRMNLKLAELGTSADTAGNKLDKLGKKADTLGKKASEGLSKAPWWAGPALAALPAATNLLGVAAGAATAFGATFVTGGIALATYGTVAKSVISQGVTAANAVQAAQIRYNASVAAGTKQATAYAAEQKAIRIAYAQMSPAQVELSKQLGHMSDQWMGVKKSVTPVIALSVQPWIKGITAAMGFAKPIITGVGSQVGILGKSFDSLVKSSSFASFAKFIGTTGASTVGAGGGALLNFFRGFINLLPQFKPLIDQVDGGITKLGKSFLGWSQSQKARTDITHFMAWFQTNGPQAGKLLVSIGKAVGTLLGAFAMGGAGTEIKLLTGFFNFVAKLPKSWVAPFTDAIGAMLLLAKIPGGKKIITLGINWAGQGAAALLKLLSFGHIDIASKFGGSSGQQKAADTQIAAAELQNKASDKNLEAAGLGGKGGGGAGAAGAAEKGAAAGAAEKSLLSKLGGLALGASSILATVAGLALLANAIKVRSEQKGGLLAVTPQSPGFTARFGPLGAKGGPVPVSIVSVAGHAAAASLSHFAPGVGAPVSALSTLDPSELGILGKIARLYGITIPQAEKIASSANLDLRKSWDDQSKSVTQAQARVSAEVAVLKLMPGHTAQATKAMGNYTASLRLNGAASSTTIAARHQLISDLEAQGVHAGQAKALVAQLSAGINQNANNISMTHPTRESLIKDLEASGMKASTAKGDVNDYTKAVEQNGSQSSQAASARAKLIKDLENAGLNAKTARTLVSNLSTTIGNMHGKTVAINVNAKGQWSLDQINAKTGKQQQAARGWMVSGGTPGKDSVPIMAMPGELVVPTHLVPQAPASWKGKIPGFAGGGVVGSYAGSVGGEGKWAASDYAASVRAVENATAKAAAAGIRAAQSAAQTFKGGLGRASLRQIEDWWMGAGGPGGGTAHVAAAITGAECVSMRTRILARRGWLAHDEVRIGDETIGYDPETGYSGWTPVLAVLHFGPQPTVRFGNKYWSAECTPNHRWLTERVSRPREGVPKHEELACPECGATSTRAKESGRWVQHPFRTSTSVERHRSRAHGLPPRASNVRPEQWAEPELVAVEDFAGRERVILARKAKTAGTLPVTTREAALLGWVAGDGGVDERHGSMSVYQTKAHFFSAIDYAAGADPLHRRYDPRPDGAVTWHLTAPYSRDLMSRAGHPKRDAVAQVLAMSTEQRDAWLDAMICAEGCWSDGKLTVTQDDGPVADAIELAIYLGGHRPGRSKVRSAEHNQAHGWANGRPSWAIRETAATVGGPNRRSFTESAGEQPVWCVTTGLGSWTAEQDGQVFLTGNSGFNPKIVQQGQPYSKTGWGLWQITPGNSEPQAGIDGQLLNGPSNAKAAVAKYRGAGGFSPWTTFGDGAYRQFMAAGGTAKPGWAWVGEQGPELVHMRGGEQVVDHAASMMTNLSGLPGYAKGTDPKKARELAELAAYVKRLGTLRHDITKKHRLYRTELDKDELWLLQHPHASIADKAAHRKQMLVDEVARRRYNEIEFPKRSKLEREIHLLRALTGYPAKKKYGGQGGGGSGSGSGTGGSGGGGGSGGSGSTAPAPLGTFVGMMPLPPGEAGGGDYTGGGSGGLGGSGAGALGLPGAPGYGITPAGGPGAGTPPVASSMGMTAQHAQALISRMDTLIQATRSGPALTGAHLAQAFNGVSRSAQSSARWNTR